MRILPSLLDLRTCIGICEMTAPKNVWQPWWNRPTEYNGFELRNEFKQGLADYGYRPNSRAEAILAMYSAGFVRSSFSIPKGIQRGKLS